MTYSPHSTIDSLFAECARRSPASVALVVAGTGETVAYAALERRAESIARHLRGLGVGPGQYVALLLQRSPDLIAAMLGVLKTGAAYVPLDSSYPDERLEFMLGDASAAVCLTDAALLDRVARLGRPCVAIEGLPLVEHHAAPTTPVHTGASPAYLMYTSGSTGRPKGAVVPHRAVVRLVTDQTYARLDATRVTLHLAPASFDASTFEIWGALLNGGRCVLAPDAGTPDLRRLQEVIARHGVTTLWLTASLFNTVIDHAPDMLATVDEVLAGGEALSVSHVRRAQSLLPRVQLINGYGPTESTTFACCYRIPRPVPETWRSIPIGSAIAHSSAHILDGELRDVVPGHQGELCIGGDGLAIEYLNLPELTAERFVVTDAHGRLYRTGDRARRLENGQIEFLGRDDDQVKIRGYRVELGEIEAALRATPGVADTTVALREDVPGDKRLVAYYTLADCVRGPSPKALRDALAVHLPEYMVPSSFVVLDALPLTPNGKVDRRALPAPGRRRPLLQHQATAPRSLLEQWLSGLWREVLQLDDVGVHDRFFELGGTSITALRLLARLNEETLAPIPTVLLFGAPTIAEMAAALERDHRRALPEWLSHAPTRLFDATPAGERLARRRTELLERRLRRKRAG